MLNPPAPPATEPVTEQPTNPLLERVRIPGETFTLPSQGLFYKNGELSEDCKNGEVYIYPMVAIDEIILKTPDKLFSGEAIIDVFKRCVPSVNKPLDLLAKDIDYILVCLRKLTYGDQMDIEYKHNCKDAKDHTYGISMDPFIRESKKIDPTTLSSAYVLELDNNQVIHLSPPRFGTVLKIYQSTADEDEANIDLLKNDVTNTVADMVESVDGITDKNLIREWVEQIPAGWIHQISQAVEKVSDWGPSFETEVKCQDCGENITLSTPINPLAFFI